jgi:hypothetical protein
MGGISFKNTQHLFCHQVNATLTCFRKGDQTNCVALFVLVLAVLLSAIQFLFNRSLWFDEANLALNIISKGFVELMQPLDHNQVAPVLYLQLTKAFSLLTPNMEYGLRILPLISFWASLVLLYSSLRHLFKEGLLVIMVLSLFAFNPTILYFSSEVKQYMTDVFVAVLFLYLSVKKYEKPNSRFLWLAIAGMLAVWLSNIAPLVLVGVGAYLLFQARNGDAAWIGKTAMVGLSWLISFAVYYVLFVQDHPTREFMISYWRNEGAFLPTNPFSREFLSFLKEKIGLMGNLTFSREAGVIVILFGLAAAGIVFLLKQKRYSLLSLLVVPLLAHMILSLLELYPFGRRLVLYLVPLLILLSAFGMGLLLEAIKKTRVYPYLSRGVYILPIVISLPLWGSFPQERQEIKRSIRFISENAEEGQQLFLPSGSISAYRYYSRTGFADPSEFARVIEIPWRWSNERGLQEFMTTMEGPCWVLFSHDTKRFEAYLLEQASEADLIPLKSFRTKGSSVYLFLYDTGRK